MKKTLDTANLKKITLKLMFFILGNAMTAYAIILFLKSNLGSDPITLFIDGVATSIGWTYGNTSIIYTAVLLLLGLIFARKYVSLGTVVGVVALGPFVDIFTPITERMFPGDVSFMTGLIMMLVAQVLLSLALAIIISQRLGMGTADGLLFKINEVTNIKYQHLKLTLDFIYTVIGFSLGSVVGIGTVVSLATTGFGSVLFIRLINSKILCKLGIDSDENNMPIKNPLEIFKKKVITEF